MINVMFSSAIGAIDDGSENFSSLTILTDSEFARQFYVEKCKYWISMVRNGVGLRFSAININENRTDSNNSTANIDWYQHNFWSQLLSVIVTSVVIALGFSVEFISSSQDS